MENPTKKLVEQFMPTVEQLQTQTKEMTDVDIETNLAYASRTLGEKSDGTGSLLQAAFTFVVSMEELIKRYKKA